MKCAFHGDLRTGFIFQGLETIFIRWGMVKERDIRKGNVYIFDNLMNIIISEKLTAYKVKYYNSIQLLRYN